jgi:omega-6 fatty acid desaturase (delta-12 desaturase)
MDPITAEKETLKQSLPKMSELNKLLAPYQRADPQRSVWQLVNTIIPYVGLWVIIHFVMKTSYLLALPLILLAALFMVRIFIFFHDCGHNSFFPSTKANRTLGFWLGVLVFTPSEQWWHSHAIHHASSGNLDKRGIGDVTTLTVDEYFQQKFFGRVGYRLFRSPLIMFTLGPLYMFLLSHRVALPRYGKKETMSVVWTNVALLVIAVSLSLLLGWQEYLMIQLPILLIGGSGGIFLFYVQHQFEDSYWERAENWDYVASALLGASYLKLPKVLQWFSGNIGFHHVHHLSPRIPNYNLEAAHENVEPIHRFARVIGIRDSLYTTRLKLFDEPVQRMVGFIKERSAERAAARNSQQSTGD